MLLRGINNSFVIAVVVVVIVVIVDIIDTITITYCCSVIRINQWIQPIVGEISFDMILVSIRFKAINTAEGSLFPSRRLTMDITDAAIIIILRRGRPPSLSRLIW